MKPGDRGINESNERGCPMGKGGGGRERKNEGKKCGQYSTVAFMDPVKYENWTTLRIIGQPGQRARGARARVYVYAGHGTRGSIYRSWWSGIRARTVSNRGLLPAYIYEPQLSDRIYNLLRASRAPAFFKLSHEKPREQYYRMTRIIRSY